MDSQQRVILVKFAPKSQIQGISLSTASNQRTNTMGLTIKSIDEHEE